MLRCLVFVAGPVVDVLEIDSVHYSDEQNLGDNDNSVDVVKETTEDVNVVKETVETDESVTKPGDEGKTYMRYSQPPFLLFVVILVGHLCGRFYSSPTCFLCCSLGLVPVQLSRSSGLNSIVVGKSLEKKKKTIQFCEKNSEELAKLVATNNTLVCVITDEKETMDNSAAEEGGADADTTAEGGETTDATAAADSAKIGQ